MLKSPRDPALMPGTWNLWQTGKNLLLFACPKCADVFVLLLPISSDGKTQGKVKCPLKGCKFEDQVLLVGWNPEKETS